MTAMLDATLARWEEAKVAQGVERGLAQGVEQGLAQGVERGLEQGLARGVERGLAQGLAQGVERGLVEGRVALLGRMAERRFGAGVAGRVTALLADEKDLSRLDAAGEWLLECDTGETLLARLARRPPRG